MPSISSVYMCSCVMMAMKLKLICLGLGVLKLDGAGAKLLGRATLTCFKVFSTLRTCPSPVVELYGGLSHISHITTYLSQDGRATHHALFVPCAHGNCNTGNQTLQLTFSGLVLYESVLFLFFCFLFCFVLVICLHILFTCS